MALFSEDWKIDALTIVIGAFVLVYIYIQRIYSYWERKGFKTLPNYNYIFGHLTEVLTQKVYSGDVITRLYNSTSERFVGMYGILLRPILLVRDPELIRTILVKDFAYFTDRDVHCNEENDPLSGILFTYRGQKWKKFRTKLTPAFSSG